LTRLLMFRYSSISRWCQWRRRTGMEIMRREFAILDFGRYGESPEAWASLIAKCVCESRCSQGRPSWSSRSEVISKPCQVPWLYVIGRYVGRGRARRAYDCGYWHQRLSRQTSSRHIARVAHATAILRAQGKSSRFENASTAGHVLSASRAVAGSKAADNGQAHKATARLASGWRV
jgi:hypothetical protein